MSAYFILYVADQARSRQFYRAALACEPRLDVPGMTEFQLARDAVLGLMPEAGIRRLLGEVLPWDAAAAGAPRAELYLQVEDVAVCHARALQAGARELSPPLPRNWGELVGYCADPDGHVLAFAQAGVPEVSGEEHS